MPLKGVVAPARLMPLPQRMEALAELPLAADRPLQAVYPRTRTARLDRAVARLVQCRRPGGEAAVPLVIECDSASDPYPSLDDDETHTLTLSGEAVRIAAPEEWGVLRALATLTQLCTEENELPALHIADGPRFAWRGVMLDVARHFIPHADLLRTLDAMAVFKLNVLHLHLSDDQGFRFPSERYPRLASDEHYTRAQLQDLVAAAADRGIRVVPELDVPGHATSWLTAHPEWGNRPAEPSRRFGVHRACLDPTRTDVLEAVETLFGELAHVFPDPYLHIGGDEVHPAWWSEDPDIRTYMERNGLADAADLQARLNIHLNGVTERLGRRTLAWDEVLHPDLPVSVTVQAWRGATARDRALAHGHDCVVSAPYYLDLFYPADVHYRFDPAAPQTELLDLEDGLLDDPRFAHVAGGMAWTRQWREGMVDQAVGDDGGRLLGAEACLWSELVDARVLDIRLWSRMPALAERFWSPAACRDVEDLYRRLEWVLQSMPGWAGVDVAGDAWRLMAEAGVPEAWRALTDMLEPVKWYGRLLGEEALAARLRGREMPQARPYDMDAPLHRVVDALPPESLAARRLALLARAEAGGDAGARAALAQAAAVWLALPEQGGPEELEEPVRRLRELGHIVLGVLDGELAVARARDRVLRAAQPMGEYLLAPALVLSGWLERRAGGEDHDG